MLALYSPLPRPVTLAGRSFAGRPLRLRDLFALAELAAVQSPAPLIPVGDPGDPVYRQALRDAYDAAGAWPPPWTDALETTAGGLVVLGAVLRDAGLDEAGLVALWDALTPAEWAAVLACAFRADPWAQASTVIDAALGVAADEDGTPWAEAIAETARELGVCGLALLELTLPELRLHRSGGQRPLPDRLTDRAGWEKREQFWDEAPEGSHGHA